MVPRILLGLNFLNFWERGFEMMKKYIMLFALTLVCQKIDNNKNFISFMRCENDEVVCYLFQGYDRGGMSCEFKGVEQ